MPEIGICSECGKSPRHIHHRHPETRNPICSTCYRKLKIKKEKEPKMTPKQFLGLTNFEAAHWITDSASQGDNDLVDSLTILLNSEAKSQAEWVLKRISKASTARRIVMSFLETVKTKEAEKIKSLIY